MLREQTPRTLLHRQCTSRRDSGVPSKLDTPKTIPSTARTRVRYCPKAKLLAETKSGKAAKPRNAPITPLKKKLLLGP